MVPVWLGVGGYIGEVDADAAYCCCGVSAAASCAERVSADCAMGVGAVATVLWCRPKVAERNAIMPTKNDLSMWTAAKARRALQYTRRSDVYFGAWGYWRMPNG